MFVEHRFPANRDAVVTLKAIRNYANFSVTLHALSSLIHKTVRINFVIPTVRILNQLFIWWKSFPLFPTPFVHNSSLSTLVLLTLLALSSISLCELKIPLLWEFPHLIMMNFYANTYNEIKNLMCLSNSKEAHKGVNFNTFKAFWRSERNFEGLIFINSKIFPGEFCFKDAFIWI